MGQSFDLMPASERARRYREMAVAACQLADDAPSFDGKADYLRLASAWHQLAVQLELEMSDLPSRPIEGRPA